MANWNPYLFDGFGSYDPMLSIIALSTWHQVSTNHFPGSPLHPPFWLDGDERRIDTTMTKLRSLVERTGIALFLVSHLKRTSSDQNHEEGARVTLGQLRDLVQSLNSATRVLD